MTEQPFTVRAQIQKITVRVLLLKLPDGQTLEWPKPTVPEFHEGDSVELRLLTEKQATEERFELARKAMTYLLGNVKV